MDLIFAGGKTTLRKTRIIINVTAKTVLTAPMVLNIFFMPLL
jgi:hypothetical protein